MHTHCIIILIGIAILCTLVLILFQMLRGINRKSVLISGGYRGICIKNYHDSENQDLLIWENIYKVSYKAAKLVIKHSYPPDKVCNLQSMWPFDWITN